MKKHIIFCLAAALCASCATDAEIFEPGIEDADEVRFSGSPEDTRVSYHDNGEVFKIAWDAGDAVGFFASTEKEVLRSNVAYDADQSAATTDFSPVAYSERIRWADETSEHTFYAYSPFNEQAGTDYKAVAVSIPAVQKQAMNSDASHLPALDFMYAGVEGLVKSEEPISLNFKHAFSILDLHIPMKENVRIWLTNIEFTCTSNTEELVSFENGRIDLATGEIDLSGATGSNSIRLECDFATSDLEDQHLFLMVTPGHAGETFEISSTINGTKYVLATRTVPQTGLPAGKIVTVDAILPEFDDKDLYQADDLSAGGTANCYIVNKADGYFKFRADVKGNDPSQTFEPKGVVLLWYTNVQEDRGRWTRNVPIVLKSLAVKSDGYVYFETPAEFVNGNTVIAVLDKALKADEITVDPATRQLSNADILWSWNLIFSEGYDPNDPGQLFTKEGYTFMKRDLGAVLDPDTSLGGYTKASTQGNCYQWGRKDPFPHIADYASANADYMTGLWNTPAFTTVAPLEIAGEIGSYGKVGNQIFGNSEATVCGYIEKTYGAGYTADQALEYAAQNPHLWIRSSKSSWIPANEQSLGNWGKGETKTVNDPCPAGWMVMSEAAWMVLSDNMEAAATAKDRYVTMNGEIFPLYEGRGLGGHPDGYTGSCSANIHANYFTANAQEMWGDIYGRTFDMVTPFNFDNDPVCTIKVQTRAGGAGARIRCVKEK